MNRCTGWHAKKSVSSKPTTTGSSTTPIKMPLAYLLLSFFGVRRGTFRNPLAERFVLRYHYIGIGKGCKLRKNENLNIINYICSQSNDDLLPLYQKISFQYNENIFSIFSKSLIDYIITKDTKYLKEN